MLFIRCPICNQEFDPERSTALPFCSDRCKRIDLGRWLDERYALPIERPEDDENARPPADEE
ncbi:MAG TPA: DNA gyrase inhibitor YacG [Pirellulales bacterium]|jgi:hypothetical protein|nr:DNA gyrase inhibitor YacG [Pirellulales bacterium]